MRRVHHSLTRGYGGAGLRIMVAFNQRRTLDDLQEALAEIDEDCYER